MLAVEQNKSCRQSPCKFKYVCSGCQGEHRASDCLLCQGICLFSNFLSSSAVNGDCSTPFTDGFDASSYAIVQELSDDLGIVQPEQLGFPMTPCCSL